MNFCKEPNQLTRQQEARLRDRGFGDLIDSRFFQRLAGVSFLATLDLVYDVENPTSRYDHSIGVASFALDIADRLALSPQDTEVLVLANLLHDIGHAPFSHNSEPFLVEKKNMYHKGLLSTYLRYNSNFLPDEFAYEDLLGSRSEEVRARIRDLIVTKSSDDHAIFDLFYSPLNCDKLDGNPRTARHLRLGGLAGEELLGSFARRGNGIYLVRDRACLATAFWNFEKDLYWRHIYVKNVFAAEAMVTRALELAFDSPDKVDRFVLSTDAEAFDMLLGHRSASRLARRLLNRHYMKALSETHPDIYQEARALRGDIRFDRTRRLAFEGEIAGRIGTDPTLTITHFSLRKYFDGTPSDMLQMDLFDSDPDLIRLSTVRRALATSKISGDFFEVFYSDPSE